ncbi:MAG: D-alanyl-D-alanine carboxypeptidase [Clostridia bacterium]|nr:D-alanyl-D-alanine carboxypeptidase [Clostridia bacterium]
MIKRFAKAITVLALIAALTITWAVPPFGTQVFAGDEPDLMTEHEIVPAADINTGVKLKVEATSAILIDAGSGTILYEKNAYKQRDLASVTKIVTCMVALKNLDMDQEITVGFQPTTEGSTLKVKKGETFKVKDLMYALMLRSANDVAEVLAVEIGGSIDGFADMMNDYAASCGAEHTHFKNPNGLNPDEVNNVTTAYDLALISRCAMKNSQFRKIVSTSKYYLPPTNKRSKEKKVSNSNRLLNGKKHVEINGVKRIVTDPRCTGIKTGYTSTAGDCIVASGKDGDTELISVVLNSPHELNKYVDTLNIWDYGFGKYESCKVVEKGTEQYDLPVKYGEKHAVKIGTDRDMVITVNKGDGDPEDYTTKVEVKEQKPEAPVKKGEVMGQLVAYNKSGDAVGVTELVALEGSEEGGPLSRIGIADEDIPLFIALCIVPALIIILLIMLAASRKKRRRKSRRRSR